MISTIIIVVLPSSWLLYRFYKSSSSKNTSNPPHGYILKNHITHARLLPKQSTHSFTYPTISLLVSLNELEGGRLDIWCGWLFGYGGVLGRVVGLRSGGYLGVCDERIRKSRSERTIREKLLKLLTTRFHDARDLLGDVWMMTMPSLLGFEGINPLTVYFCYKPDGGFWLCVLEIHNTFGESHVHLLQVGQNEDRPGNGYDHQWTFRREFHVSPFNDRSGFYTVSIRRPRHAPTSIYATSATAATPLSSEYPQPVVRVQLYTASPTSPGIRGPMKLVAVLRCTSSAPLTASSLLASLAWAPLALFLSFPRILYHAWILHYIKRLDVFIRPEPSPANPDWLSRDDSDIRFNNKRRVAGGVKWQPEGVFERFARRRVEALLRQRVNETGVSVSLVSANPSIARSDFLPTGKHDDHRAPHLQIDYLSPRFFTILFLAPSSSHALLLGRATEKIFFPSSSKLFLDIFSPSEGNRSAISLPQKARLGSLPHSLVSSLKLPLPSVHPLDSNCNDVVTWAVVILLRFLEITEMWVFWVVRARPVKGDEPWKQWLRAESVFERNEVDVRDRLGDGCGSVYNNGP